MYYRRLEMFTLVVASLLVDVIVICFAWRSQILAIFFNKNIRGNGALIPGKSSFESIPVTADWGEECRDQGHL